MEYGFTGTGTGTGTADSTANYSYAELASGTPTNPPVDFDLSKLNGQRSHPTIIGDDETTTDSYPSFGETRRRTAGSNPIVYSYSLLHLPAY